MFAIEMVLLTDRYAAASVNDMTEPEWPPHPVRVFSALTAALHDSPEPDALEADALRWLAAAGAPQVLASPAERRSMGSVYVPTNAQTVLANIDRYIDAVEEAEAAVATADASHVSRAERAAAKARQTLAKRSASSVAADGKGVPATAAELVNRRLRPQPRYFPAAIPWANRVRMIWPVAPEPAIADALDRLCARVARVGHSSSLVSLRSGDPGTSRTDEELIQRWFPSATGTQYLRVPLPDQLELLQREHQRHQQVEQRVLPAEELSYSNSAAPREARTCGGVFSDRAADWIVFEVVPAPGESGRRLLDASAAEHVARALRGTLMRQMDGMDIPASLSGHEPDGSPAADPHVAWVALPDVRRPDRAGAYASGSILAVAVVLPRDIDAHARRMLLRAVYDAEHTAGAANGEYTGLRLTMGRFGEMTVRRLRELPQTRTSDPARWTQPSRRWASVTAVALSRNPGNLLSRDAAVVNAAVEHAERTIALDLVRCGHPQPEAVWVHRRSLLLGSPAANRFAPYPRAGNGPRRVCVHAEVLFSEPVAGPVLVGAGRFFGVGLFSPLEDS